LDYIRDRDYLAGQICAGIRDPCISGFLAAILMKDSCGVYVQSLPIQVYFKKELVRRLIAQALQSSAVEFFEGLANLL
jgi:hypothetical protein